MTKIGDERIARGLCSNCGKEAAPWRLCGQCRFAEKIRRVLRKAKKHGLVKRTQKGRDVKWSLTDKDWSGVGFREAQEGDKRLEPRLGGIPVDIEDELVGILVASGVPMNEKELVEAWGRLRVRRGRESAAKDLAYVIEARRNQAAKISRRAERHSRMSAP